MEGGEEAEGEGEGEGEGESKGWESPQQAEVAEIAISGGLGSRTITKFSVPPPSPSFAFALLPSVSELCLCFAPCGELCSCAKLDPT
jgi:hypothetical protein